jgi:hypothetical protein
MVTILNVNEKLKKDEFPSLSSSFAPIKKNGIWGGGEGKKSSLEIAKEIAHIPSPTPASSPSPNLQKTIRIWRRSRAGDDDDFAEEDTFDNQMEYRIRKNNEDFDNGY